VIKKKGVYLIALEGADVPGRIQLLPMGQFTLQDDRGFNLNLTPENAQAIIAHFEGKETDMVVDYHHNTFRAEKAPAAGWIKKLEADESGLWAIVEWTPAAAEHIKNKEYRYISPVILYLEDGTIIALINAALTNTPAIGGMDPLTLEAENNNQEDNKMLKALLEALGLTDKATEAEAKAAIAKLQSESKAVRPALLEALGLKPDATEPEAVGAIKGLTENKTALESLQGKVAALEADRTKSEATVIVEEAIKSGKIALAQRDAAIAMAEKDLKGYTAYLEKAPVILDMQHRGNGNDEKQPQQAALSAEIKATAAKFGLSDEDLKTYGGIQ